MNIPNSKYTAIVGAVATGGVCFEGAFAVGTGSKLRAGLDRIFGGWRVLVDPRRVLSCWPLVSLGHWPDPGSAAQ